MAAATVLKTTMSVLLKSDTIVSSHTLLRFFRFRLKFCTASILILFSDETDAHKHICEVVSSDGNGIHTNFNQSARINCKFSTPGSFEKRILLQ
jgi:hypothetical protein